MHIIIYDIYYIVLIDINLTNIYLYIYKREGYILYIYIDIYI